MAGGDAKLKKRWWYPVKVIYLGRCSTEKFQQWKVSLKSQKVDNPCFTLRTEMPFSLSRRHFHVQLMIGDTKVPTRHVRDFSGSLALSLGVLSDLCHTQQLKYFLLSKGSNYRQQWLQLHEVRVEYACEAIISLLKWTGGGGGLCDTGTDFRHLFGEIIQSLRQYFLPQVQFTNQYSSQFTNL